MILKLYHGLLLLLSSVFHLHGLARVKLQCTSLVLVALLSPLQKLSKDREAMLTVIQLGIKVRCPSVLV